MATLILHRLLAEEAGHFFRGAGVGDLTHRAQTWLMVDMLPEADRLALAEACLRYAVLKAPQYGRTYCNLGYVLEAQGQLAAALRQYRRAVDLGPEDAIAQYYLGRLLAWQGHTEAALAAFDRAIEADPDHHLARWRRGIALLLMGDYAIGWKALAEVNESVPPPVPVPRWDGTPFPDKTLLIHGDGGYGDVIQKARLFDQVATRGGRVILACHAPLMRLMHTVPGVERVIVRDATIMARTACDLWVGSFSLQRLFGVSPTNMPGVVPYLRADPTLVHQWRTRLGPKEAFRVGLVWQGDALHENDRNRSCSLADFAPLAQVGGVQWVSLQVEPKGAAQLDQPPPALGIVDIGRQVTDFADTAAVMMNLDLIVTVDSSPAHLAGALGRPVWLMLPFVGEWRWGLPAAWPDSSFWYPSMTLFRQEAPGDWAGVVQRVREALTALLAARAGETGVRSCSQQLRLASPRAGSNRVFIR